MSKRREPLETVRQLAFLGTSTRRSSFGPTFYWFALRAQNSMSSSATSSRSTAVRLGTEKNV